MTYDEFNKLCKDLLATTYVTQWGGSHVWKVGGKVFAIGGWEKADEPAFTFKASERNFDVLKEQPGFRPAPYMGSRGMKWIQLYAKTQCDEDQLRYYIEQSYRLVSLGLTKKKREELGL